MRMLHALTLGSLLLVALAGTAHALGQDAYQPVVNGAVSRELYPLPGLRPTVYGVAPLDATTPPAIDTPIPDVPPPERAAAAFPFPLFVGFTIPDADVQAGAVVPAAPDARPWLVPLVGLVATAGAVALYSARPRLQLSKRERARTTRRVPVLTPVGPDDVHGLLRNGNLAAQKGDLDEATAWFRQAASVAPTLAVAHFCHGTCLWGAGRAESAMRAYSRAVDLDPSDGAARIQLARVQLALGEANEAMVVLAPVLRDVPEFMDVMRNDPDFAALVDHPVFLAMAGVL